MKSIICERAGQKLSEAQLKEIAGLIYDTDLHIYPAMFRSRQEAENVLPKMIRSGDRMFRTENMFIARSEKKITGVLLWTRGPLEWDKKIYEKCGGNAEYIDRVIHEYFYLFREAPEDMTSVVRIGVKEDLRGRQIGSLLMDAFMREEPGPYQLFVLANNVEAVPFFEKKGFKTRETRSGFSLDYSALPCFWMVRN